MIVVYYLIWVTIYTLLISKHKKHVSTLDFILIGLVLPIIEESVFRHTLIYYTNWCRYYKEFNAILFACAHLTNRYFTGMSRSDQITQFICTGILGYYFVNVELTVAIYSHIIINTYCVILLHMKRSRRRKKKGRYTRKGILKKSLSLDDLYAEETDWVFIEDVPREYDDLLKRL